MKRQKYVFIIPGFRQSIGQKGYSYLRQNLKKEGYIVVPIRVPWKGSTITDNTTYFLEKFSEKIEKYKISSKNIYFLGFSYGALIAFLAATKIHVAGLILCSLSPFFKEDLPKILPKNSSSLQLKRLTAFANLHGKKLAKKIKAKSVMMLYGANESKPLIARVTKTFKQIPSIDKYLFSIQNTQHNIADKKYVSAIQYATKTFL